MNHIKRLFVACTLALIFAATLSSATPQSLIPDPGTANVSQLTNDGFRLWNEAVEGLWEISDGKLTNTRLRDRLTGKTLPIPTNVFAIISEDAPPVTPATMNLVGAPAFERLTGNPNASRLSDRVGGQQVTVELENQSPAMHATWRLILRDGSNYFRQELTLHAESQDLKIVSVRLIDVTASDAYISGTVKGSPVVAGSVFYAFEHPLSESHISQGRAICSIARELPLKAGQSITYSSVIGVTPPGQLRRGFLNYVERERAHPYRPFLHYNSWYDLGYFNQFDEKGALDVIHSFGEELVRKRGVKMDSFLFDDGWDDPQTLWHFHNGFPNGFTPLREAAAQYGAAPGVWLSPWGGYGKPHQERMKYGKDQGFEMNTSGFALSGPKYFERFRETTLDFINRYGVNQFKIDGTGNVDSAIPGSQFDSDFHAAISLIDEWRRIKPDIYVNLTTGTYPSPFWLRYADSTWRGGEDHDFTGVGSYRQKWITYRDSDTYAGVVQAGPLYPLNSLMLHGIIYARHAKHLDSDPNHDFADEVHDYFGTGTQLQEMYITPSLLAPADWDTLAEAAKWSRANADVLVDTHWVGGDPALLEVYGWASWSSQKAILVLRNPSDKPQSITLDIAQALQVPAGGAVVYTAQSPWKGGSPPIALTLEGGHPRTIDLKPFEVLTLDLLPKQEATR